MGKVELEKVRRANNKARRQDYSEDRKDKTDGGGGGSGRAVLAPKPAEVVILVLSKISALN